MKNEHECERCKEWQRCGLSNTCPSCDECEDLYEERMQKLKGGV